jgi:Bacterial Ig-like domain (group 3)
LLLAVLAVPAAASAAPDYTWSGAVPAFTPLGNPDPNAGNWSNPNNWVGGVASSGPVGTLTFPFLGSGCAPDPHTGAVSAACYKPKNDLPGINVNALDIGGGGSGAMYHIGGDQITLGNGGITTTPDIQATAFTESDITAPLSLSAPQTWTINGTSYVGWLYVDGDVSGASNALQVNLNNGNFAVGGDLETGPISISGPGSVYLGSALGDYLAGALNGNDGNPVSLGAGESMFDQNTNRYDKNTYDLGPLTLADNTLLQLGQPEYNASVTLPVNGGLTFSPTSHLSLLFNSHITATGPVNLAGAALSIEDGTIMINGSPACNVLDVDTLITTAGSLTGTFQGIPDGAIIPLPCGLPVQPLARINYTAHSVIATLWQRTTTALDVSDATPPVGRSVTVTATVTPEREGDGVPVETVEFLDGGQPIAGCSAQPLTPGSTTSSASCDLSFQTVGTRSITATYSGSSTFEGSTSSQPRVIVVGVPAPSWHQPKERRPPKEPPKPVFRIVKVKAHGAGGTIQVETPGPGTLSLIGFGVKLVTRPAPAAGVVSMPIRPWAITKVRLESAGKTRVHLKVTFAPISGVTHQRVRTVLLQKG